MKLAIKKESHIAQVRQSDLTLTQKVQNILGWSHQQYCNHQYEQYEAFIARECAMHPDIAQILRYSETFRGFWNNEWIIRNQQEFMSFAPDAVDGIDEVDEYMYIHSHQRLINDMFFMNKYECILKQILKQGYDELNEL